MNCDIFLKCYLHSAVSFCYYFIQSNISFNAKLVLQELVLATLLLPCLTALDCLLPHISHLPYPYPDSRIYTDAPQPFFQD